MGVKLALGAVAVGAAVIAGAWWALRSPAESRSCERVANALSVAEVAATRSSALRQPGRALRAAVTKETPAPEAALATTGVQREWMLELELRGQYAAESEPVAIVVSAAALDAPRLELTHPLLERTCSVDVGPLFAVGENRPAVLRVALDHPQYLPLEANVLVPEELRQPAAQGGRLSTSLELKRASAFVTGTVAVESGGLPARLRVALHAMEGSVPANEPIERVRPAADGSFRLRADAAAEHAVVAYLELKGSGKPSGLRPETRLVTLAAGETRQLEPIVVGAGATIAGQASFHDRGPPLPGHVQLHLEGVDPDYLPPSKLVWVEGRYETWNANIDWDEQGRFHITGLAPCQYSLFPILSQGEPPTLSPASTARGQLVTAPAMDVRLIVEGVRVTFLLKDRLGAPRRALLGVAYEDGAPGNASTTDDLGRICVVLDASRGLHCTVDDFVHVPKKAYFSAAELASGGPIEITIDDVVPDTATLAILKGPRARELAEGVLLDVRFYDRSDERAMWFLRNAGHTTIGSRPSAQAVLQHWNPKMDVEDDGTQVISELRASSYVVVLSPRSADPERACLLLPAELELELAPGERVDHEWQPEVGGTLRVNYIGSGRPSTSLRGADGRETRVSFRERASLPGVMELQNAVPPGRYAIHFEMEDGTERIVPVQVEAGRFNDVEIDLGAR